MCHLNNCTACLQGTLHSKRHWCLQVHRIEQSNEALQAQVKQRSAELDAVLDQRSQSQHALKVNMRPH